MKGEENRLVLHVDNMIGTNSFSRLLPIIHFHSRYGIENECGYMANEM